MSNERSAASASGRSRRAPAMMVIAASTATFAAAVQGAPPAPPTPQPASSQAPPAAPPRQPSTPGVTNVQAASTSGPVSGGGDAPHGALPMTTQTTRVTELVRPFAPSGAPPGIEPSFWKAIVPADNAGQRGARRARSKALLRHAALEGRHGRLRHLPRREPRLHRPARHFRGHRRQARPAQRADHAERRSSSRRSSGTAARRRSRSRPSCRS